MATTTAAQYQDQRAHDLRARYHAIFEAPELPVPVESIAEDLLGLHVEEANLGRISGLLYPSEMRILLNATDASPRRRFTLAHELGHWICQCVGREAQPVYCRTTDVTLDPATKTREREANIFAAELLMPEPAVRSAYVGSSAGLGVRFGVSDEAMAWRLYSFDLGGAPH
jgi:Zn-dependent peptidase ImmA (M78 family)